LKRDCTVDSTRESTDDLDSDLEEERQPPESAEAAKPQVALRESEGGESAPPSAEPQEKNEQEDWIAAACADWPRAPDPEDDDASQRLHWAVLKRQYTPKQLKQLYERAIVELHDAWLSVREMEGWRPMGRPNFQRLLLAVTRVSPDGDDVLEDFDDALEAIAALDYGCCNEWVGKDGFVSFGVILNEDTRRELVEELQLGEMVRADRANGRT
jgi:hypothetical protein